MPKFVLSTIMGVESVAKKEIEKQGGKIEEVTDRLITFSGEIALMARMNIWSRVGNKLYLLLNDEKNIEDFDSLYDLVGSIGWRKYAKKNYPIVVKATSIRSELFSTPTIQKITKKAIVNSINKNSGEFIKEDGELEKLEIFVLIIDNRVRILLNTSGNALHMRGYRTGAGKAPIKESLAAALILLSSWRFKENFYDPFCGSGTIPIEALMIAKNIAPGLKRNFAYEKLSLMSTQESENERKLAKQKIYSGDYKIFASDKDPDMINIAKQNVKRAGLDGEIEFSVKDFNEYLNDGLKGTLVSNPPYGERLKDEDLEGLYKNINKLFKKNSGLKGGIISSYMDYDNIIGRNDYKKRKLYNGGEMCYFWKKK